MGKHTILIADNDQDYVNSIRPHIENAGYEVIEAQNPQSALEVLKITNTVDLVIIDVRMKNDKDELDLSGIDLANNAPEHLPKIINTNFPTTSLAVQSLGTRLQHQPLAVDFIRKSDGIDSLLSAIGRTFWRIELGEIKAQKAIFEITRSDTRILFWVSIVATIIATGLFFVTFFLTIQGQLPGLLPLLSNSVPGFINLLIFTRVDAANKRADHYLRRQQYSQSLDLLLEKCDHLSTSDARDRCIQTTIEAAQKVLFDQQ